MVAGRLAQEAKRDACSWSKSGVDRQSDGHQTPVLGQKDKCVGCRGRAARGLWSARTESHEPGGKAACARRISHEPEDNQPISDMTRIPVTTSRESRIGWARLDGSLHINLTDPAPVRPEVSRIALHQPIDKPLFVFRAPPCYRARDSLPPPGNGQ